MQGWSEQLGGQVYVPETALNDPSLPIVRRAEQIVPPGSVNIATLHCVADCLTSAGMQQSAASQVADPYGATTRRYDDVAAVDVLVYQVGADGVLTHAGTPVVFSGNAESLAGSAWQGGFRTGRLVADLAPLECSPGSATYCANKAEALTVFYTWETGPNPWNEYAGARDARGNLVAFTPPLRVTWSVPDAPVYGDLRARDVVLQYPGFGDLHGIPGACVNPGRTRSPIASRRVRAGCHSSPSRWTRSSARSPKRAQAVGTW
ncbi:MAG: hypothetical protein R3E68_16280 [Burkholderiaceae bacterium]